MIGAAVALLPIDAVLLIGGMMVFLVLAAITPWAVLAALLVLAPLRTLIATESTLRLPLDIGQLLLIALFGIWLIGRIATERRLPRLHRSPLYLPITAFIVAAGLSAFSALSTGAWFNEWLKWVQVAALIVLCLDLAGGRRWEGLIFALACAGVGNAVIGIYQYFGGSGALHLLIGDDNFRAFGTFGQPNPFGAFMGIIAPLTLAASLGYAWRAWESWQHSHHVRWPLLLIAAMYAAASGVMAIALVMSYSRGAWLGFGIAVGVLVFAAPRRLWQGIAAVLGIAALVAVLWISGRLPASITDRIRSATEETFTTNDVRGVNITPANYALVERLAHWQAAIRMAEASPLLGVGFGNYEAAYPRYRLINWEFPLGHAHNYYLNVLAETGVIGLSAYLVLWIGVAGVAWRARWHPDPLAHMTAAGMLASTAYIAAHSLTDNVYVNNLFLHTGIVLGVVGVIYNQTWQHTTLLHRPGRLTRML